MIGSREYPRATKKTFVKPSIKVLKSKHEHEQNFEVIRMWKKNKEATETGLMKDPPNHPDVLPARWCRESVRRIC